MKNKTSSTLALVAALALALPVSDVAGADTWDISKGKPAISDGKVRIPGSGQRVLLLDDPAVTLVEDANAPGGVALGFSGTQAKPLIVSGGPFQGTKSLVWKVQLKPAGNSTEEGTVLQHSGACELRVKPGGREVRLYVTGTDKGQAAMLRSPLTPDEWNTVEVSVKDSEVALTVNGHPVAEVIPNSGQMNSTEAFFRIGKADAGRPYKGLLADLMIAQPAE